MDAIKELLSLDEGCKGKKKKKVMAGKDSKKKVLKACKTTNEDTLNLRDVVSNYEGFKIGDVLESDDGTLQIVDVTFRPRRGELEAEVEYKYTASDGSSGSSVKSLDAFYNAYLK